MVTYEELNRQNHKITELTNVLIQLLGDRSLCDSDVTCDLFFQYVAEVQNHMAVTDKGIYAGLLTHKEREVANVADRFMSGSVEIKRIFGQYLKKWCQMKRKELVIKEYDAFYRDTEEMFRLVLDRIQDETEHLYPLMRKVTGDQQRVA